MWNRAVFQGRWRAFAMFLSLSGCTALSDCKYELGQKIRSGQAWHEFDGCNEQCFTGDYRDGWKRGYYEVLTGGDGRPPVVPPKKYWRPPVFAEHDPSRQNDWYTGYQDGASCAKCQPDHHYVPTFLPDSCPTPQFASHSVPAAPEFFPLEHVQSGSRSEGSITPSPEPETPPDGAGSTREGKSEVEPPVEKAPKSRAETYEKDPEPSSTSTKPVHKTSTIVTVASVEPVPGSLLRQLVLNAAQEPDGGATNADE